MESNPSPPSSLPATHRALVLRSTSTPPTIETPPTPQPTPGSAILRIHATGVLSYMRDVYLGNSRNYRFPLPMVPGIGGIARVAAVGPDAVLLRPGQLVYFDCIIRGRDDPSAILLSGLYEGDSAGSAALMAGEWRDGTFAQYAKVPLENVQVLDERRLCGSPQDGGLGYAPEDLVVLGRLLVPFGGLSAIGLRPGETIVIAPATGPFGGAAVQVALAMGAKVIAMGRNKSVLESIAARHERVAAVPITGDVAADTAALRAAAKGPISVYFDISPPFAAGSTHLKSAILSLAQAGRVSLMGGFTGDVTIPHLFVMHHNISIQGTWMCERKDVGVLVRMVEGGMLKLGEAQGYRITGKFGLEEWKTAFDDAAVNAGMGESTVIMP